MLALALCSCADSDITSRMQDPVMREEYVKQLKAANIKFSMRDDSVIIHDETLESLTKKMKPYDEWLSGYDKEVARKDMEARAAAKEN
jgi:hypothetical protein